MRILITICALALSSFESGLAGQRSNSAPPKPLQMRLGYSADAKLLILNADDLGVSHAEDVASFAALDRKLVTSATAMSPCPWFTAAAAYAKAHPEADIGLHLTLRSEWDEYRWGPISRRASLVMPDGYFYPDVASGETREAEGGGDRAACADRARQIDGARAFASGRAYMHVFYATPELFGIFLKVARAYKLPIRMARSDPLFQRRIRQMRPDDPIPGAIFSPGANVPASRWLEYYVNLVKNLQPRVTDVFVHLAMDDAESQAVMMSHADWGAAWRQREWDAISSPAFGKALEDNHVTLIGWRALKSLI